ncbi:hypothetical protein TNCV_4915561 [Trichonephila clavipes]|nr:hypothetical protein TNCV_4915561 [Trichonephila clavipes]
MVAFLTAHCFRTRCFYRKSSFISSESFQVPGWSSQPLLIYICSIVIYLCGNWRDRPHMWLSAVYQTDKDHVQSHVVFLGKYHFSAAEYKLAQLVVAQGHTFRRIRRINDTGPTSYRAPTYVSKDHEIFKGLKKGVPKKFLIHGPLRTSYASAVAPHQRITIPSTCR